MAPVLVNGSPKLPRLPMPAALDHESFDITLHRKDSEGFGFVILTSKSKPPYGGESPQSPVRSSLLNVFEKHVRLYINNLQCNNCNLSLVSQTYVSKQLCTVQTFIIILLTSYIHSGIQCKDSL